MTRRPLQIVQAAAFPFPSPQGSQVYVRGMARALARRGHDVTVACYAHGIGDPDPEYRVVRTPSVPGYGNVRAGPDLVKPLLDAALAFRISGLRADIIHAHNYEAPIAAALARLRTGTPVVYNAHNTMAEELHTYFEGPLARRLARQIGCALDRTVPRLSAHAIAISEPAVPVLEGLGCRRVTHVPPGVDPMDLPATVPEPLPAGPWVVYAGNPDRYQDLDVLVEAMRQVPEAGLLMVSASPLDEWSDCGLSRLHLVRTSEFARVRALLAASAVAALPRAVCSGYPIKLLNYLGMGLPTVAAHGSAQDLPGVVPVPDRDPGAMASAIRSLLRDSERRRRLGRDARAHVLAHCTWDARAAELEAVYAEVLDAA
ncbi:MAG: glycosyltransferase family 4 protein [Myxococcota bacterium]|nr:glycosyltransferase family 4 protein [Myxococcota bacterium]